MAVKTVQTVINGQTYTLTLNSSTGKYEATVTAPSKSSYNPVSYTHLFPMLGMWQTINDGHCQFPVLVQLL